MFDPTQKVITEVDDSLSFRDIFKSLTYYPISYAHIIDGDVKVNPEDFDKVPGKGQVLIRLYPGWGWHDVTDGFSNASDFVKDEISDVANIDWSNKWDIAQTAFAFIDPVTYVGLRLLKAGSEWLMKQLVDIPTQTAGVNSKDNPSLKGGSNQSRYMQRLPVLLGKHLIHPDIAALSYIDIAGTDGVEQYLYMLFCAGYNNISVTSGSYKIGETEFNTTNFPDSDFAIKQNGDPFTDLFPYRRIATSVSTEITVEDGAIIKTTPTNTRSVEIFITFPRGLYTSNNGKIENAIVKLKIEYRIASTGTWYTLATPEWTRAVNETIRFKVSYPFDNLTTGGADYSSARQYDIRVTKLTADTDSSNICDSVYWDTLQSVTGVFNTTAGTVDCTPVDSDAAKEMTLIAIKVKASQNVNGELATFNFIGQSVIPVYSGSGSGAAQWATSAASSNPAAVFLYVIRESNINKNYASVTSDQINWSSFEAWYTYCNTNGYECNTYITSDTVIEDLLNSIVTCGRATWSIVDGKFNIIIDQAQAVTCQYFTPRNSWGLSASKNFDELPTGLRLSFIDAAQGYVSAERYVYADEDTPSDDKIDDYDLFACTSSDEAWKRGRYILANLYLRRETFTFSADIEHISCTRWDRIALSHDVCSVGLGYARIKTLRTSGGNVVGFEIDERVTFEPSTTYAVTIRCQDGQGVTYYVQNPASSVNVDTDEITLETAITSGSEPFNVGDLLMFGVYNSITLDLIITDIEPSDDYSAKITCIPYVAELYTWESGDIPEYDPKISTPGDLANSVFVGIPVDAAALAVAVDSKVGSVNNYETALTSIYDTLIELSGSAFNPAFPYYNYSTETLYYLNLDDGLVYSKGTTGTDKGTAVTSIPGYPFTNNYMVRPSDGYIVNASNTEYVLSESWSPQVDESGNIIYAKLSDGGMYIKNAISGTITRIGTFTLKNFNLYYYGNDKVLVWDDGTISGTGVNEFILIDITTGLRSSTLVSDVDEVVTFKMLDYDTLLYLGADMNIYRIELADSNETLLYIANVSQFDAFDGVVYYLSTVDGHMYLQFKDIDSAMIDSRPYLRTTQTTVTITGSGTADTNIITGVSAADLGVVFIGDSLSGTGIASGTKVISIDTAGSRILASKKLTSTFTSGTITVTTSQLQIDASKAVADGSVNFYKLATDAVGTAHLVDLNVIADKLGPGAVTTDKIYKGAVTDEKLADDAVRNTHIYQSAVTTDKIADYNITLAKLHADFRLTETYIDTGAVSPTKIATGYKLLSSSGDGEVKEAHINSGAVTPEKIATNYQLLTASGNKEVKTDHLDDLSVSDAKIAKDAVIASKIKKGEVTSDKLETNLDFTSKTLVLPNSTSIAPTTEGSIGWDTDDNLLKVGDGSATKTIVDTNNTQTLSNKTFDSSCNIAPKAKFNDIFANTGTKTQNDLFDTLSPYIASNGNKMQLSGVFYNSSGIVIVAYAERTSSTTIEIYGIYYTGSTSVVLNSTFTDGSSTAIGNCLLSF